MLYNDKERRRVRIQRGKYVFACLLTVTVTAMVLYAATAIGPCLGGSEAALVKTGESTAGPGRVRLA